MDTIAQVVNSGLCTGCGTCAGVCPSKAIKMRISNGLYLPKMEEGKCTNCGLCVKSCPGYSVNFGELNSRIFGKQPENILLGNFLECYVGHSNDKDIRYNSSSGGIVTHLLVFALQKGIIDGALLVRMKKDKPLEPEPFIARTRKEIISASKSKYCPVAVNEALELILNEDGRFAVVGLPCHIHGIRKAEELLKELKKRIVLHIGLMCSHTVSFTGTEFLLEKMHIKKEQVTKLDYRGNGWPGLMSIQTSDRKNLKIPLIGCWNSYWPIFSCFFFTPLRCIMCSDQTNELADVSLGDAWFPELRHEKSGESVIVIRTRTAKDIVTLLDVEKVISIKAVNPEKVKLSQALNLQFKKNDLSHRLSILNSLGKETPKFIPQPTSTGSPMAFLRAFFPYFNVRVSSSKYFKSLLLYVRFPLFRLYYGVYKFLSSV